MPNNSISPERQAAYYAGNAISGLGLILFLSNFFIMPTAMTRPTSFDNFGRQASEDMTNFAARAIGGMILIGIGQAIASMGKLGAAGSGVVLNPEQARKDVEPWSRMVGGVVSDALDEVKLPVTESKSAPVSPSDDERPAIERLSEIKVLLDKGMLTQDEYEAKRKSIIDSI